MSFNMYVPTRFLFGAGKRWADSFTPIPVNSTMPVVWKFSENLIAERK